MRWSILAVALMAVGCTGAEKDKDAKTDEEKTDGTEGTVVVDTGDTGPGVKADFFQVSALFATDGASALSFTQDGTEIFPSVVVSFATNTGTAGKPELGRMCSVLVISKAQQAKATWLAEADPVPWFGFNVPTSDVLVNEDDCIGKWDKETWGSPGELVASRGFGAALAPLRADLKAQFDAISDQATKDFYLTNSIGAGWQLGSLAATTSQYKAGYIDGGFTFGAELKDGAVVKDSTNPTGYKLIPAADLYKDDQLATAVYIHNSANWIQTTLFTLADTPSAQDFEVWPVAPGENPALDALKSGRLGFPIAKIMATTTAVPVGATPLP